MSVNEAIHSLTLDRSEFGALVVDCRSVLQEGNFTLSHVKRKANAATDALAKSAPAHKCSLYWQMVPPFLEPILSSDVISTCQ